MSGFKVGDLVEIIGSQHTPQQLRRFIGRTAIIASLGVWQWDGDADSGRPFATLSPSDANCRNGWFLTSLRKINPPDWSAPLTTDKEVTA